MKRTAIALVMTLLTALPVSAESLVEISDAWARATILTSRPGVAYLTITSAATDRLLEITTAVADHVMIHDVVTVDDVRRMRHVMALDVPANRPVTLAPGAMHLMLAGLHEKLREGQKFPMTLRFENAGEISIDVAILGIAAAGPQGETE
ncbi:copper chaperone PCu(A)C [Thalassospira tepidiphila]|jgi:periplasmic copper chaperone A|uniref:copper chaperone PCu(A)C n=1 Tax=Thalassospira tepidiphila TaxID=393657 RepID=UPI001BCC14CF|nr:copper chaperone PCu(A)C [Thalassospira tepidiphila]MBS8272637.1 copper chaperone PCu(A)C [Thalassospira tepidiphila]